jgi:hypothetical protein
MSAEVRAMLSRDSNIREAEKLLFSPTSRMTMANKRPTARAERNEGTASRIRRVRDAMLYTTTAIVAVSVCMTGAGYNNRKNQQK